MACVGVIVSCLVVFSFLLLLLLLGFPPSPPTPQPRHRAWGGAGTPLTHSSP